jgi:hypothetical protein
LGGLERDGKMTSILSKLLEAENLDNIFQPFSEDELAKKSYGIANSKLQNIWVDKTNHQEKYYFNVDRWGSGYYMIVFYDAVRRNWGGTNKHYGEEITWEQVPNRVKSWVMARLV